MGLHFILGGSGSGKTTYIYEDVLKKAAKDKKKDYIIIVPEQFTLQTQKDLINKSESHAIGNVDAVSFLRLAYRMFEEKGGEDRIILEDTGKSMIVKKVLLEKKEKLVSFAGNVKRQGFVDEVKSVISEFSQYDIGVEDIDEMLEKYNLAAGLKRKLADLRTVYEGFNEFIEKKYITAEGIYAVMAENVTKSDIIKRSDIYIDGFTGFTPSQYRLVRELIKTANEVYITVTIDKAAVMGRPQLEHQLFYLSYNTILRLEKLAAADGVPSDRLYLGEDKRHIKSGGLKKLSDNIFRFPYKSSAEKYEDVSIWVNNDRQSEITRTAIEIKRLIKEKGYRYRDIAVVSGDVEGYGREMAVNLEKLGIASFVDSKQRILTNPAVEMLRSLIEMVEFDFRYESVFRFLKTGLTDISAEESDALENYVIALGIRGKSRYSKPFTRKYKSSYDIDLDKINEIRGRLADTVLPVYEVLRSGKSTVNDKLTAVYELFVSMKLEEKLDEYAASYESSSNSADRARAKEYSQVYRIILEVFDRIAALLGDDIIDITEFREILDTGLKEAKAGLIPPGIDQIVIGDIERTRLKDIKALFILGVNDGLIPKNSDKGGILNVADRSIMMAAGIELAPSGREKAYMTEFYMYLNMTKPSERLYLSYICVGEDGKPLRNSYIISKVNAVLKGIEATAPDKSDEAFLIGTDCGRGYLSLNMGSYFENDDKEALFAKLFKYYREKSEERNTILNEIISDAFGIREDTGLSDRTARLLYGNTLTGSVTRMEKYAACAFAHFMMYGLRLEERAEFEISMPDIGTIYHNALDMFSKKINEEGESFKSINEEKLAAYSEECAMAAVADFGNGILESSKRNEYVKERVKRILYRTVKTVSAQVRRGKFEPWKFEQAFEHTERFMRIKGRIDRMDIYETDGRTYIDIIDYKSGTKKFDLESLYYGLSLQLAVYMREGMKLAKEERPDDNIVPAGMFYYNIDDPVVDKCDNPEEKIEEALRMNGMVNSRNEIISALDVSFESADGGIRPSVKSKVIPVSTTSKGIVDAKSSVTHSENLSNMAEYAAEKMHDYSKAIMAGDTSVNPYKLSSHTACDYCSFAGLCGFDASGDGFRRLKKLEEDEIFENISRTLKEKKDEVE